jgi:hypothetical protein
MMKLILVTLAALFATAAAWNYAGPYEKVSSPIKSEVSLPLL